MYCRSWVGRGLGYVHTQVALWSFESNKNKVTHDIIDAMFHISSTSHPGSNRKYCTKVSTRRQMNAISKNLWRLFTCFMSDTNGTRVFHGRGVFVTVLLCFCVHITLTAGRPAASQLASQISVTALLKTSSFKIAYSWPTKLPFFK